MLDRIVLMADHDKLPIDLRKLASHVGGISPGKDGSEPKAYDQNHFRNWADPGNDAYKAMVDELLGEARRSGKAVALATGPLATGYAYLTTVAKGKVGDCVEAALAGAFAASRFFP